MILIRLRQYLVFQAFLFWQGGFLFYSGVVVPVGTDVIGATVQGMITQQVTEWMAIIGVFWHLLFAWDLLAVPDSHRLRARLRQICWLVSFLALGGLVLVHHQLDVLLEGGRETERSQDLFRLWHGIYLWGATGQWILGLAQAWWTLGVWTESHTTVEK